MEGIRDLTVIFLLIVIAGFLGQIAGAVTGQRFFTAMGGIALLFAFAMIIGIALNQAVLAIREYTEARAERRAEIAQQVEEWRNDVPVTQRRNLDPVKRLP